MLRRGFTESSSKSLNILHVILLVGVTQVLHRECYRIDMINLSRYYTLKNKG